jgi:mannose-6-phosphate isomerase
MSELYPLKFETVLKEKVWGGNALAAHFNKKSTDSDHIGESWELSAISGDQSVISNGFLAGNNIEELIEVYMGDITGDQVYEKFGNEFPLLIKFIEAQEDLSIQVHPNNELAKKRHKAYGKTEMWYILECKKNSKIYTGFKKGVTKEIYEDALKNNMVENIMNVETPEPGNAFFTPAGRVHAIGAGIVLVEIQQTSDITYRIFDWNRKDRGKEKRELHTDLAIDAIDFNQNGSNKLSKPPVLNNNLNLVNCEFFNTNLLWFNKAIDKEYHFIDSFVVYICTDGEFQICWDGNAEKVMKGETVLLPAMIKEVTLKPTTEAQLLEVYINSRDII